MTDTSYTVFTNAFGETTFSNITTAENSEILKPVVKRAIFDEKDLENFKSSESSSLLLQFIQLCADSVVGKRMTGTDYVISPSVHLIEELMNKLIKIIDEIPPLKQPMRFGNKAFRQFHQKLTQESTPFVRALLEQSIALSSSSSSSTSTIPPTATPTFELTNELVAELCAYLTSSFGNEVRIDYGTGHELNFTVFLYCLYHLNVLVKDDLTAAILHGFGSYILVMRKLQQVYMLEPAGSHGVWGLDDYHCLTFLWGAAQLCLNNPDISPNSIHDMNILREYKDDYLYLEGIFFIRTIKSSAPFSETSPMLNDISGVSDWGRVTHGLVRLFQAEVLFKRPVVQHLPFGSILKCSWIPNENHSSSGTNSDITGPFESGTSSTFRSPVMGMMPVHTNRPKPIVNHHTPIHLMSTPTPGATDNP